VADIQASAASDGVLRESGSAIGFGTIATGGIANNAVTNAKMATMAANTVKANATGGSAVPTDVTAATARSNSLLNIDQATSTGDANYTILATDRTVYHTALSAARTDTLPAANAVNAGQLLKVIDPAGVASGSNTVTLQRAGSDTVNGGTTFVALQAANGMSECISDGTSKWACAQIGASGGSGITSVTPGGGLVSALTSSCSQTAITSSGTLSSAGCVNSQTGTSYAIADSDRGKVITASNAAAQAYTIAQAGASSQFVNGWCAEIINISTTVVGVVTITPTTSTIDGGSTLVLVPGQRAKICSDGTNYQVPYMSGVRRQVVQVFTASGTYTPTVGMITAVAECVGGGGSGGGYAGAGSVSGGAGGGGGGGYARKYLTASDIGASKTVTIGAGGTAPSAGNNNGNAGADSCITTSTCVSGQLVAGKGGGGGGGGTSGGGGSAGQAGVGGQAGTGDIKFPGSTGTGGIYTPTGNSMIGGQGGSSYFGGQSNSGVKCASAAQNGNQGDNYGVGGQGACSAAAASNAAGGAGGGGVCIVTENVAK
jgi:hypothetical protein